MFDVEEKVAYMVDPTLTGIRTVDELHTYYAKLVLERIHHCLRYIFRQPEWQLGEEWEYRGVHHGRKEFRP